MTMISPYSYAKSIGKSTYDELIQERDRLIDSILSLEAAAKGVLPGREQACPSDQTVYSCNLQYLAELMKMMATRCKELEWAEPELDAMESACEGRQKAILVREKVGDGRMRVLAEEHRYNQILGGQL